MVGEERFRIERLLTELQTRTRRLNETLDAASRRAEAVRQKDSELQSRLAELTRERERLRDRVRQEGEDLLREGRRAIEEAIRRLRSSQAEKTSIRQAKEELQRIHEALPAAAPRPVAVELSAGQRIRIPHLGLEGQVVELRGRKVIADAAGMRLTLDRDSVATAGAEMPREQATSIAERKGEGWRWVAGPPEIRPEIDLRGLRGEEAWQKLDLLIDRAIPAGLKEINVIHGVGTGRLRQTLCDCLGKDPRVQAWREAPLDQGGHGVTIVTLAED
jgi:DNA mismatch repair protein MutS2